MSRLGEFSPRSWVIPDRAPHPTGSLNWARLWKGRSISSGKLPRCMADENWDNAGIDDAARARTDAVSVRPTPTSTTTRARDGAGTPDPGRSWLSSRDRTGDVSLVGRKQ